MAWHQDAMDTVALVALAPFLLAMVLSILLRARDKYPFLTLIGLLLVAYPYNAHWTVTYLLAAVVLAAGGLSFLWDVLFGHVGRPGRRPKKYVLQRAQDPPPPRPPWPPGRG